MSAEGEDRSGYQIVGPWGRQDFGFVKATESTGFIDPTFAANWANLHHAGLARGAYHFFHPGVDPIAQAEFFMRVVKAQGLLAGDMLVADVEITSGADGTLVVADNAQSRSHVPLDPAAHAGLTEGTVNSGARAFLDKTQELAGRDNPVLVYTNLAVGSTLGSCTHYDLWIAYPSHAAPANVSPWHTWRFWQWGFGGGYGGGDRDAYNGTASAMHSWLAAFTGTPPGPQPGPKPPTPTPTPAHLLGEPMLLNRAPDGTDPATSVNIRTPLSIPSGVKNLIFTTNGNATLSCQFTGNTGVGPDVTNFPLAYGANKVVPVPSGGWNGAVIHRKDPGDNDVSVALSS